MSIPSNYGGSAFSKQASSSVEAEPQAFDEPSEYSREEAQGDGGALFNKANGEETKDENEKKDKSASLLGSLNLGSLFGKRHGGETGGEELLIIALILLLSDTKGNDELILLLILLLFIK